MRWGALAVPEVTVDRIALYPLDDSAVVTAIALAR